ncbi:MAG: tetratricopeptide repeat protein, partial [Sulfurimonadaceae bacterium]|nr:tetratricopeptide repeat protein [Sulfurimonadaceae bacterium]
MSKWLSLLLVCSSLFGLELTVNGGKEEGKPFSTIHLKHTEPFLCEAQRNDFDQTSQVVCAFNRRPSQEFAPLSNNFFSISSETRGKNYFIIIKPYAKMELFPVTFKLHQDKQLFDAPAKTATHWTVVGFTESMPLLRHEAYNPTSINFPVAFSHDTMPYVGGLDIKGNPIKISRVRDVSDYITIKRFYRSKNYDKALELVDVTLANYPDSIFRSELLLYQMRCYHHLGNPEGLLEISKSFLRVYSSDENVPEVLAYTANAYSEIGLYTDADYFFDRLFTEHEGTRYAHLGKIYKAQQLADAGNSKKALTYYEEALNEAKDVEIAAEAAFKMTEYYIEHGKTDLAAEYIGKIIEGHPDYLNEFFLASRELGFAFAGRERFDTAAAIFGILMSKINAGHEFYESMLKDRGIWLAGTDAKSEAAEVLDKYLKQYQYGEFSEEVKRAKDALFFDLPDQNVSQKLATYEALQEEYAEDPIAEKALYKKAQLLMESGHYREVLDMNASLALLDEVIYTDAATLVNDAARALMQQSLEAKQCLEVITLSETYEIELSETWDEGVYECAYYAGNFAKAKGIAVPYIKSKDVTQRMTWLYRYIRADFATGNYEEVAAAADELIALAQMEQSNTFNEAYRLRFDALQRMGERDGMIKAIAEIEKVYGLDFKDIERYTQMVTLAKERKESTMVEVYAAKVIALQKRTNSYSQSPYIEFTLVQALMD